MDWLGDSAKIVQVPVGGGEPMPLSLPFRYAAPAGFSPDLSELLIGGADRDFSGEVPLWFVPVHGGSPRRVGDIEAEDLALSPDGRSIFFAKGSDLYVTNSDGTGSRKLGTAPGMAKGLYYSPDGRVLRFIIVNTEPNRSHLWEVSADGSNLHQLLPGWSKPGDSEYWGSWTPDGRYFIFGADHNNLRGLWAIRETGGFLNKPSRDPVLLTTGQITFAFPCPSLDGKKLFALGMIERGELMRYEAKVQQFLPYLGGIAASDVDFSPDGQWVAYSSNLDNTLWRSRVDGSERRQLTFPPMFVNLIRWSPDGKRIAFNGQIQGKTGSKIYWVSAEGGTPQQLMPGDVEEVGPQWSPDGNQILFGRLPWVSREPLALYLVDLRANQVSAVPGSVGLSVPRWSYDGRYAVAIEEAKSRFVLFDWATHARSELARAEKGRLTFPKWSRDGKYVFLWTSSAEGQPGIYRIRLSDREMDLIASDKQVGQIFGASGPWLGLTPDNSPLIMRVRSFNDIYAFDWDAP
jgi:Tol biopolymer transport system component